ncbi:MAG: anion permease [Deltaproteobacteria bacterium]|nr:anion permease [Deltaproteobacteria bacterium]MBW1954720.1 anion permease [Deltaproteobacteria bacterium]MBW2040571.1 anion permease [Deltaproteobacteria bacterium]MBW2131438.1 anion permease [Deltaproteobacteria bacterium]
MITSFLGGIFLGWSLGANDAANAFGTAVSSRMVKFYTAAVIGAVFVVTGALLEGRAGIETLQGLTAFDLKKAVICSVAAALTVTLMTVLGLPISTSQAVVGAILGIGILSQRLDLSGLSKVVTCWVATPIGGALIAMLLYPLLGAVYNRMNLNLFQSDRLLKIGLICSGAYGAYALGANNVANVSAVFVGAGSITVFDATLLGGLSIALGILTFSRPVMETVGRRLVRVDPYSALVVVIAMGLTVHAFTWIGVPVSTSHATVGAVLGIGILRSVKTVNRRMLGNIVIGWGLTPVLACLFSIALYVASNLYYVPD